MKFTITPLATLIVLSTSNPLLATDTANQGDIDELIALLNTPVEVSSNKAVSLLQTPSTVSVLDQQFFERYDIQTLAEAVEMVAGMWMTRSYYRTNAPIARGVMQDAYPDRFLMLIDGVPVWNVLTNEVILPRINIHDVERIEVLRGPSSVIYGSNAFSGAVNVILRKPSKDETARIHGEYLDQGGNGQGASVSHLGDGWNISASIHRLDAQGESHVVPGENNTLIPMADYSREQSATLTFQAGPNRFLFNHFQYWAPYFGTLISPQSGGNKPMRYFGEMGAYQLNLPFAENWRVKYELSYDRTWRTFNQQSVINLEARNDCYRLSNKLALLWTPIPNLDLELGTSHEKRVAVTNDSYLLNTGQKILSVIQPDIAVIERSAYLQAGYKTGSWNFNLGTRYTKNELFDANTSSRASVIYAIDDKSCVKFNFGQAFESTSMANSFAVAPTVFYGNKDLKPQTANFYELSYMRSLGKFFFNAIVFMGDYKNTVDRVPRTFVDPNALPTETVFINNSPWKNRGAELEVRFEDPKLFNSFMNISYTEGNKGDARPGLIEGYSNLYIPTFLGKFGVSKKFMDFNAGVVLLHQGPAGTTHGQVQSWTGLNLNLDYSHAIQHTRLRHSLFLKNSLDKERYFPEYGRRNIEQIPEGMGRWGGYSLVVTF